MENEMIRNRFLVEFPEGSLIIPDFLEFFYLRNISFRQFEFNVRQKTMRKNLIN